MPHGHTLLDYSPQEGLRSDDFFWIIATKADIEAHFATHGTGDITEVKLMNGFGFIEYKDPMDARDVVPGESSVWLL